MEVTLFLHGIEHHAFIVAGIAYLIDQVMPQVTFCDYLCNVSKKSYAGNRIALVLTHAEDGSPVATATVNLPEYPVPDNHVLIKDWSENEGMYKLLLEAGVIKPMITLVPTGYVHAYLCELNNI